MFIRRQESSVRYLSHKNEYVVSMRKVISLICGFSLIVGCGGNTSTDGSDELNEPTVAQSDEPTVTSTSEDEPTWVLKTANDAYQAPVAQTVCDLMRDLPPPDESSAAQVESLEKWANNLRTMMSAASRTYATILAAAEAILVHERKTPTPTRYSATGTAVDGWCDDLGLTPENSKFGLKNDETNSEQDAPSTTVKPGRSGDYKAIVNAVCRTTAKENKYRFDDSVSSNMSEWVCSRGSASVGVMIPSPEVFAEWREDLRDQISDGRQSDSNNLCGDWWTISSSQDITEDMKQELEDRYIVTEPCSS